MFSQGVSKVPVLWALFAASFCVKEAETAQPACEHAASLTLHENVVVLSADKALQRAHNTRQELFQELLRDKEFNNVA